MRPGRLAILVGASSLLLSSCASSPRYRTDRGSGSSLYSSDFYQRGLASFYGYDFHGKQTANGETYDSNGMTAAHRTLPFSTILEVKNIENGRKALVRVNDRGPFVSGRVLDLSMGAARALGMVASGTAEVEIRVRQWGKK